MPLAFDTEALRGGSTFDGPSTVSNPTIPLVHSVATGRLLMVRVVCTYAITAISDSKGNAYTLMARNDSGSGVGMYLDVWASILTTALVGGTDNVQVHSVGGNGTVLALGTSFSGASPAALSSARAPGTAYTTNPSIRRTPGALGIGVAATPHSNSGTSSALTDPGSPWTSSTALFTIIGAGEPMSLNSSWLLPGQTATYAVGSGTDITAAIMLGVGSSGLSMLV